jgi:hypothetical protein
VGDDHFGEVVDDGLGAGQAVDFNLGERRTSSLPDTAICMR